MKRLFFIAFLCVFALTKAQSPVDEYVSGPSVLSPGPTASGLGKYAEFPVSLYTGIPNIGIPIYTVSAGELAVPVSLSYHSKGIQVGEQASWVGLGWSLNAGGVVTRSVVGLPDDQDGNAMYTTYGICGGLMALHDGFLSTGTTIENLYFNNSIGPGQANYLYQMGENTKDGEPDRFFFNFNGISGEFVLDKNGVPSIASDRKLAISYTRGTANRIVGFKIIDENGTIYSFDAAELTYYYINTSDGTPMPFYPYPYLQNTWQPEGRAYYSSWYLTKIENANKTQEINFTYTNENLKDVKDFSYDIKSWLLNGGVQQMFTSREYYIEGKRLSSITWAGGSLTFEAAHTRQDIGTLAVSDNRTTTNYALTKIIVRDYNNVLQKSFLFDYGYFTSTDFTPNGSDENCLIKRPEAIVTYGRKQHKRYCESTSPVFLR